MSYSVGVDIRLQPHKTTITVINDSRLIAVYRAAYGDPLWNFLLKLCAYFDPATVVFEQSPVFDPFAGWCEQEGMPVMRYFMNKESKQLLFDRLEAAIERGDLVVYGFLSDSTRTAMALSWYGISSSGRDISFV